MKLVAQKDGPVVGVHIVGDRVGELIAEAQLIYNWEALPSEVASSSTRTRRSPRPSARPTCCSRVSPCTSTSDSNRKLTDPHHPDPRGAPENRCRRP